MARKTILVSDMNGDEIPDEKHSAKLVITFGDARKGQYEADLTEAQGEALIKDAKARSRARRGRRPKSEGQATPAAA